MRPEPIQGFVRLLDDSSGDGATAPPAKEHHADALAGDQLSPEVDAWLAQVARLTVDLGTSEEFLRQIAARREACTRPVDIAAYLSSAALILSDIGRSREGLERAIEGVRVLQNAGISDLRLGRVASLVGTLAVEVNDIATAADYVTLALRIAADTSQGSDARALSQIANNAGAVFHKFEAFDHAIDQFRRSAEADMLVGDERGAEVSVHNVVEALLRAADNETLCDRHEQARAFLDQALQDAEWMCAPERTPAARDLIGPVSRIAVVAAMERHDEARTLIDDLDARMADCDDATLLSLWGPARIRIALHDGDVPTARATVDQMFRCHWIAESDTPRAEALRLAAEIHEAAGDAGAALAALRESDVLSRRSAVQRLAGVAPVLLKRVALESTNRRLAVASETDPLSGLLNRRGLERRLGAPDGRADERRDDERRCSVLLIDLDHFKNANDTYGHQVGDEVLRRVSAIMREHTRPEDLIARIGGEEFVIVLADSDAERSVEIAGRLRSGIAEAPWHMLAPGLSMTASFGVTNGPRAAFPDLLRTADDAMYAAKDAGRDRVVHREHRVPA